MTPDDSPASNAHPWKKAIPESRDRLQSKILVWIAVPLLTYFCFTGMSYVVSVDQGRFRSELWMILAISIFFALVAWRLKAATPLAAICGGMICLLIQLFSSGRHGSSVFHSGLTPLILLFILTREATRLGREKKEAAGMGESRRGRNAAQIIANLGTAGIAGSFAVRHLVDEVSGIGSWNGHSEVYPALFLIPMMAALGEATADTVSSEIGQAFGGQPFLLPTLRRVTPGTDGAISFAGTLAGIVSALLIAITGVPALGMNLKECAVVFAAAVFGLFFDSILGATIERKGWLGNDLVNLLSTATAAAASILAIYIWQERLLL